MNDIKISEEDLQQLFGGKKSRSPIIVKIIKYCFLLIVLFALGYITINYVAFYKSLSYWYSNDFKTYNNSDSTNHAVVSIESGDNQNRIKSSLPDIDENHLSIPKISTESPILWQINNNEAEIQDNLENGVVHINGTALPGQNGNIFITGHSSNYFWAKGSYKNIFALLNKLLTGDLIYIKYNKQVYVYNIIETKTVKPMDVSVMKSNNKPLLSLMTCTPVGTSINRLIVIAEQILPETSNNVSFDSSKLSTSLPQGMK